MTACSSRVPDSPWSMSAFLCPLDAAEATPLLRGIRDLRSRILYDRGRRPAFLENDDQPQDLGAWHFLARREPDGPVLGYIRLLTADTDAVFQSRQFLGHAEYESLLDAEGLLVGEVFEHSRLVVEHRLRKLGLGVHLNALAMGAARELGAAAMIATAGTADGQERFQERFGFRSLQRTRRYIERYTEDVVIILHHLARGAGEYDDLVEQYRELFAVISKDGTGTLPMPVPTTGHHPAQYSIPAATVNGAQAAPASATTSPATTIPAITPATAIPPTIAPSLPPHPRRLHLPNPFPPDRTRYKPVLFAPARDGDRAALNALARSGAVRELCDTLPAQLDELVTSRQPALAAPDAAADRRAAVADQLAGQDPGEYGTWVWYPWSGRLVHVLPREEFRLVRTDRNRTKIDRPDQRRLLARRVGVVGLSVGASAALTLAQEGVGGVFRLADFDTLGLSNLNRLRAGVHELGQSKAVLAARRMAEIDPYLDIEVFPHGLTPHTLDAFVGGSASGTTADTAHGTPEAPGAAGPEPLDLVVEECDTPWVKLAVREACRQRGIPVLMDTNDRGLLDIERFDLEPDRPLLHGRLGTLGAADLGRMSPRDRVDLIADMIDIERMSPQLRSSITAIGDTLSSWPQLASGVALGGALITEAARRILLGRPCDSGRFYVDLDELIAPDRDVVPSL